MNISYAFSPTVGRTRTDFSVGRRILIVDDQETILVFLRDRLEQLGFAIFTTSSKAEALELLIDVESTSETIQICPGHCDVCRSHSDGDDQGHRSRSQRLPDETYFV
jgi:hypothetical protein